MLKVIACEDNSGALSLANLEPGQHTPQSKYYDMKIHWFKYHLNKDVPDPITDEKINTFDQLADLFTKPSSKDVFERLQLKLMGW